MEKVLVGICTRNRQDLLAKALESLVGLPVPEGIEMHAVVCENDTEPKSQALVESFQDKVNPLYYLLESRKGIPHARNAILEKGHEIDAGWIAFFDDDETVHKDWLEKLFACARRTNADVVAGPVWRLPGDGTPQWLLDSGILQPERHEEDAERTWTVTGNVLFKRSLSSELQVSFDAKLALTGGSDQLFFMEANRRGARIRWTNQAIAEEPFPSERATVGWLMARSIRFGSTGVYLHRQADGFWKGTAIAAFKGCCYWGYGFLWLLPSLFMGKGRLVKTLYALTRGVGWTLGLIGWRHKEYAAR